MNDILFLAPVAPFEAPTRIGRWQRTLSRWWQAMGLDERERYLSKATDCVDLERRLRAWDYGRVTSWPVSLWS